MLSGIFKKIVLITSICLPALASAETKHLVLDGTNAVVLRGEVNGESVAKVSAAILATKGDTVNLYISSPGGSIVDGLQLINVMHSSGKKINCIASIAASMAFVILEACDTRQVLESSIVMQHVASYGLEGQAPNNQSRVNFINTMLDSMDNQQANRIGLSLKDFHAKTRNDWWLFGQEAVDDNVADNLVQVTCTPEISAKKIVEKVQTLFFTVNVTYSGCPVIEGPLEVALDTDSFGTITTPEEQETYRRFIESMDIRQNLTNIYLGNINK